MTEFRSITQIGRTEPFELQVARGHINGHRNILKSGFAKDVDGEYVTVWSRSGLYIYPDNAVQMSAASFSGAADNGVVITISGLDENYNEISEDLTLAGNGQATTDGEFLRVNEAFVSGSQSPTLFVDVIRGGEVYASVNTIGSNITGTYTDACIYTVPAGHSAYITEFSSSYGRGSVIAESEYGVINLLTREENGVFRIRRSQCYDYTGSRSPIHTPIHVPEKSDIEIRVCGSSDNSALFVTASFELILIKNE